MPLQHTRLERITVENLTKLIKIILAAPYREARRVRNLRKMQP